MQNNLVLFTGNIGAEPEFKTFESGKRKASFSIALDQYTKDGKNAETLWLTCNAWDAVCDLLRKRNENGKLSGRRVNLCGNLIQNSWTDQETGKKFSKIQVNVLLFELLGSYGRPISEAERVFDGKPLYPSRRRFYARTNIDRSKSVSSVNEHPDP